VNRRRSFFRLALFWAFSIIAAAGCISNAPVAESKPAVTVLIAASTADAVKEIAQQFTEKTGQQVVLSPGASNALAQQILSGAPADVFLSAAQSWADEIEKAGLAVDQRPLLRNALVLVVPKGNPANVQSPADLLQDAVERVALAGENVPAGKYADQALKSLDLGEKLAAAGKIVRGSDVRATLNYIERGEVEAGIVYSTDAIASTQVKVVHTFDESLHDKVVYPVVLIRQKNSSAPGKEFFDYLISPDAAAVFRKAGFLPLTPSAETQSAGGT
jgi:molybdate transport system substrate-binding protein